MLGYGFIKGEVCESHWQDLTSCFDYTEVEDAYYNLESRGVYRWIRERYPNSPEYPLLRAMWTHGGIEWHLMFEWESIIPDEDEPKSSIATLGGFKVELPLTLCDEIESWLCDRLQELEWAVQPYETSFRDFMVEKGME